MWVVVSMCMREHVHVCACACACACVNVGVLYVGACECVVCVYVRACMCLQACICVRVQTCGYVGAGVCEFVGVCDGVCKYLRTCARVCVRACVFAYVRACVLACMCKNAVVRHTDTVSGIADPYSPHKCASTHRGTFCWSNELIYVRCNAVHLFMIFYLSSYLHICTTTYLSI